MEKGAREVTDKSEAESGVDREGSKARTKARASRPLLPLGINWFESAIRAVESCECESMPCPHIAEWRAARREILSEVERLTKTAADFDLLSTMYSEMCSTLHECVQKHRLGLGGENIHELVVEEIDRCRALLPTPAEASAMLNASNYSKSSDSGWKKLRSLRDGA